MAAGIQILLTIQAYVTPKSEMSELLEAHTGSEDHLNDVSEAQRRYADCAFNENSVVVTEHKSLIQTSAASSKSSQEASSRLI